ncbi:MAG: hypothetical protein Unbinned2819contig1004_17 [Prokaryotic dsDNA virus sp.]|nr:MAG: hypothetical protein Unbinned2819contig1004_17 [Prokaryotic dsDNA virus sp.]
MPNMSYCRFENTSRDLQECLEVLYRESLKDLSYSEIQGLIDIIDYSQEIVNMRDNLEEKIQKLKEI